MKETRFGIVIPHHDRSDLLKECLAAIPEGIYYSVEGPPGTFAENCNKGFHRLKEMGLEKILFLNDDAILNQACLGEMLELEGEFDIVGARTVYPDGRPENFGGVLTWVCDWREWVVLHSLDMRMRWIVPSGACFLFLTEAYERCGLMNESYKNSCEDTELFFMARELGYTFALTRSTVVHRVCQSGGRFDHNRENEVLLRERFSVERIRAIDRKMRMDGLKLKELSEEEKEAFSCMLQRHQRREIA